MTRTTALDLARKYYPLINWIADDARIQLGNDDFGTYWMHADGAVTYGDLKVGSVLVLPLGYTA